MANIATEILIIFLLVLVNGVFAMAEIALVSVRKSRLEHRAERGDKKALAALELMASPERFLSTVQIGITLIGILAGAYGGATIAEELAVMLEKSAVLAPYAGALSIAIVVVGVSYLSVTLGEIAPKQVGLSYSEPIAIAFARPMIRLLRVASPVVSLLTLSTNSLLKLFRLHKPEESGMTEAEFQHVIHQATEAGVLEENEQEMVERTLQLGDRKITSFMTPRTDVVWLDVDAEPEENWRKIVESGHSSFPLCDETLNEIAGIVSVKHLWAELIRTGSIDQIDLGEVLDPPFFVLEAMPALKVLELLKSSRQPVAIVLDEYGAVTGLVSIQDFVSSVFFGVHPQADEEEEMSVQRADGSWLISGIMPVDDFKALFGLEALHQEKSDGYETVGGLVMSCMTRLPKAGDQFDWMGLHFEVVDLDGRRVDKVIVRTAAEHKEQSNTGDEGNGH